MDVLKVIIVDDLEVEQNFIEKIISKRNDIKETFFASNGREALDTIRENPNINLIITDYNMPKMSGLELIKALKNDDTLSHIPIIMLSAEVNKINMLEAIEAGADMEILKPFTAKDLNNSINYIINPSQEEPLSKIQLKSKIKTLEYDLSILKQQLSDLEKQELDSSKDC